MTAEPQAEPLTEEELGFIGSALRDPTRCVWLAGDGARRDVLRLLATIRADRETIAELRREKASLIRDRDYQWKMRKEARDDRNAATERVRELEAECERLRDAEADYGHDLIARFDQGAADHTDAFTYIHGLHSKLDKSKAESVALRERCERLETAGEMAKADLAFAARHMPMRGSAYAEQHPELGLKFDVWWNDAGTFPRGWDALRAALSGEA